MSPERSGGTLGAADARDEGPLGALLESAPDGILLVDGRTGRLLAANRRACEMLGYAREELLRVGIEDAYPSDEPDGCARNPGALRAGRTLRVERRMRRKNGTFVTVEASATMLRDGRWLAVVRDITERKQTEAELREAKAIAESADHTKSVLLASMSHELRTPLNAIIGFSQLLEAQKAGPLSERQARYAQHILSSGRQLLGLVDQLLELTTADVGRTGLRPERFEVGDALRDVERLAQPLAEKRLQTLAVDAGDGGLAITADRAAFKQLVYALLSSAIECTPEGGQVRVTARRSSGTESAGIGGGVEVAISDSGMRGREDACAPVAGEITCAPPSGEQPGGPRTRLSLARHLVKLHSGRLHVDSEPGGGTTVTVVLPDAPKLRRDRGTPAASIPTVGERPTGPRGRRRQARRHAAS